MADSSKTEQATPRQRQKARKRGQVTRSRELSGALSHVCRRRRCVLSWAARRFRTGRIFSATHLTLQAPTPIEPGGPLLFWTSVEAMRWVLPIVVAGCAVSLVAGLAQGGFVFAPEALSFKFERLSPADKLKQMFSPAALSTILKSLLPFTAIAWIGVASIRDPLERHSGQLLRGCAAVRQPHQRHSASDHLEVRVGASHLVRRGLPASLVEERRRPEDEPPGSERRTEADGRQPCRTRRAFAESSANRGANRC